MLTRVLRSGNSLAVCIPTESVIFDPSLAVEIERAGNTRVLRPVERKSPGGIGERFEKFSSDFIAKGHDCHEQAERDRPGGVVADGTD